MRRLRRNVKYDFVIYNCLIGAAVLLGLGAKDYISSLDEFHGLKDEVKSAVKEMQNTNLNEPEQVLFEEKPSSLDNIDEKSLINKYLNNVRDDIIKDQIITYEMIKTWNSFDIIETQYIREITDTYFTYSFIIKIPNNKNSLLPINKEDAISDEQNIYISLKANIVINDKESYVKNLETL